LRRKVHNIALRFFARKVNAMEQRRVCRFDGE
jgi:hypothetical protein